MKISAPKVFRLTGVLLGLMYFYWGFAKWDVASHTRHPILGISLTLLYGGLLVAPWAYLSRLRVWVFLYAFFVLFSLWMIPAHLLGLLATLMQPQIAALGILVLLTIEISQIPVLWIMKRNSNDEA